MSDKKMINLKIDDKEIQVEEGTTILQAARQAGSGKAPDSAA